MNPFSKIFITFCIGLITFPTGVDFAHLLANHEHLSCNNNFEAHFHEADPDCEILQFQQNSYTPPELFTAEFSSPEIFFQPQDQPAKFLKRIQKYSFSLRGPPSYSV